MRALFGITLSAAVIVSGLLVAPAAYAESPNSVATASHPIDIGATVERYAGETRYETAVAVSQEYDPGVPVVYIVTGSNFPDALSAAPAATKQGGPLLLVTPTSVPEAVTDELHRLQPKKIVIVGGTTAVSPAVEKSLSGVAPTKRISGEDRFETSRNVDEYAFGDKRINRLYVATGNDFPDALSASAAAGAFGNAVLLVPGSSPTLDSAIQGTISLLNPVDVVIAGGTTAVSAGIQEALRLKDDPFIPEGVTRLGGADRYVTAAAISDDAFHLTNPIDRFFIATGQNFPDALAGAALAGATGAPLIIARGDCMSGPVARRIIHYNPSDITIIGGKDVVSSGIEQLDGCVTNPTATITTKCNRTLTYRVNNPNPFTIEVKLNLDDNLDGVADHNTTVTVAADSVDNYSPFILANNSRASGQVIFNDTVIVTKPLSTYCG